MKYSPKSLSYRFFERKVPRFALPNPLQKIDGMLVKDKKTWLESRRVEILDLFKENVYGNTPKYTEEIVFEIYEKDSNALGGLATRKQINIYPFGKESSIVINLLLFIPNKSPTIQSKNKFPTFIGLNFFGNHTIEPDPNITLSTSWMQNKIEFKITNHKATEGSRGVRTDRWPVEYIIKQGYGLGTIYYGDITPDHKDGLNEGVFNHYNPIKGENRKPTEWGAIGTWVWGLSRAIDYFEQDPSSQVDLNHIISIGHSRLGKTSLWAGAQDERIALVISNCSGCGGAALSRRRIGETVMRINRQFPHWFCKKFRDYNENESKLPVDQHMLISLIAPRPVYVASATRDLWADPKGEYLAAKNAAPVYQLLGTKDSVSERILQTENPSVEVPIITGKIGHHIRKGKHNLTLYDWTQYIKFANLHFL
jgi:(4-O-methyl)-D-glucuronate---lignin esterase